MANTTCIIHVVCLPFVDHNNAYLVLFPFHDAEWIYAKLEQISIGAFLYHLFSEHVPHSTLPPTTGADPGVGRVIASS